jgi:hypothetical protein
VNGPASDAVIVELPQLPAHFETVKGPFLRVHGPQDATNVLVRLAQHGASSIVSISDRLHLPIGGTIHVYVVESEQQFREMQLGNPPLWADGTAYPRAGVIVLKHPSIRGGQADPLTQVLEHELVHILLGRAFLPQRPPSWLQEGVAQVVAGELGPEEAKIVMNGATFGGLLSLESLSRGFPEDPVRAHLAYAQSADFVAWIEENYGSEALQVVIREQLQGHPFDYAIRKATNRSLKEVESDWRSQYESQIPAISLSTLAREEVLWGGCGILLIFGGVMRRRQFRIKLMEMGKDEQHKDAIIRRVIEDSHEGSN